MCRYTVEWSYRWVVSVLLADPHPFLSKCRTTQISPSFEPRNGKSGSEMCWCHHHYTFFGACSTIFHYIDGLETSSSGVKWQPVNVFKPRPDKRLRTSKPPQPCFLPWGGSSCCWWKSLLEISENKAISTSTHTPSECVEIDRQSCFTCFCCCCCCVRASNMMLIKYWEVVVGVRLLVTGSKNI